MIDWPCFFGPVVRQHIMAGAYGEAKLLTSWLRCKKERVGKELGSHYPL
jgi:hypothetical protein